MKKVFLAFCSLLLSGCSDEAIDERITQLENSVLALQLESANQKLAQLDCDQNRFSPVLTNVGVFTITCNSAEQYLDGYKIKLSIGNPSYATFNNAKVIFIKGEQRIERDVNRELMPGSWTKVTINVSPLKVEDIRGMLVSLEIPQIKMITR